MFTLDEFCKDVECYKAVALEKVKDVEQRDKIIQHCKKCGIYRFYEWLDDNGYYIKKEGNNEKGLRCI